MSGIVGSKLNIRGSGRIAKLGTDGQVLTSSGAGVQANYEDAGGGGAIDWQTGDIKTSTFTAATGEGYFCNTTSGAFEMDLPAGSAASIVAVQDYANTFDTYTLTVDPNGSEKINGGSAGDPVELTTEGLGVTFVYIDSTIGWRSVQSNEYATEGSILYVAASGGNQPTATGCIVCTNYKVHSFTGPGTFCVTCGGSAGGSNTVDYLVVAGGAGGSSESQGSGAGGAGGYRESPGTASGCYAVSPLGAAPAVALPVSATGYSIAVGAGGAAGNPGASGVDSTFSTITSAGGGGGGAGGSGVIGVAGGSGGGGGGRSAKAGGAGNTPPTNPAQGTPGGTSTPASGPSTADTGGGGGGATVAGTAGGPGPSPGGPGGTGATSSIDATPTARAGGGGGGSQTGTQGTGGTGGGGNSPGGAGTANTGGGGSGGSTCTAGAGGSGIVILRYKFQ